MSYWKFEFLRNSVPKPRLYTALSTSKLQSLQSKQRHLKGLALTIWLKIKYIQCWNHACNCSQYSWCLVTYLEVSPCYSNVCEFKYLFFLHPTFHVLVDSLIGWTSFWQNQGNCLKVSIMKAQSGKVINVKMVEASLLRERFLLINSFILCKIKRFFFIKFCSFLLMQAVQGVRLGGCDDSRCVRIPYLSCTCAGK